MAVAGDGQPDLLSQKLAWKTEQAVLILKNFGIVADPYIRSPETLPDPSFVTGNLEPRH
jgi:hypothetical protein